MNLCLWLRTLCPFLMRYSDSCERLCFFTRKILITETLCRICESLPGGPNEKTLLQIVAFIQHRQLFSPGHNTLYLLLNAFLHFVKPDLPYRHPPHGLPLMATPFFHGLLSSRIDHSFCRTFSPLQAPGYSVPLSCG